MLAQHINAVFIEYGPQLVFFRSGGFFTMSLETDFTTQFCTRHTIALVG